MNLLIPGLVITEIKPAKPYAIPLSRRVLIEKWYGRNGMPEGVADPNHWLVKSVFAPNDTLYLINPVTAAVEAYSVAGVKVGHHGISIGRPTSHMFVCLHDRKGYHDSVRIKLHEATQYLNKPSTCYVERLGTRFVCCSERAMLTILSTHVIPILIENRKTNRSKCSRKKWKAKKQHFKILYNICKKVLKYLQENP